jgi:citrate synthase
VAELIDVPDGLAGVVAAETEIGTVVGDLGYYHYRGRSAPDLARTVGFETAAALVLDGSDRPLRLDRSLPATVADIVDRVDLRTGLSALAAAFDLPPLADASPEEAIAGATRLIGAFPTLVASVHHRRPIEPDPGGDHIADHLRMLRGDPAPPEIVAALRAYAVLTLDHGFSNSTFATRVVASTGADLGACVLAGFGSLTGPRHGANQERMLDMFDAIGTPEAAEPWMQAEMAARRRVQGFGHAVYRTVDPRLELLREHGAIIAPERHALVMAIEEAGRRVLAGRNLVPNLDLHAAVVLEGCGIPRGCFTATFATARIVGWCAHAIEQASGRRIIRPAARYVGPPPDRDIG